MWDGMYAIILLISFSISIFQAVLFFDYLEHFLERRFRGVIPMAVMVVTVSLIYFLLGLKISNINYPGLLLLVSSCGVTCLFYKGKVNLSIFLPTLFVAVLILTRCLVLSALMNITAAKYADFMRLDMKFLMARIITVTLLLFIVKLLEYFGLLRYKNHPWFYWAMLLFVPIGSIFMIIRINVIHIADPQMISQPGLPIVVAAGLLLLNIVIFCVVENSLKDADLKIKIGLMSQQIELQGKFYEELKSCVDENKRKLHDIKNQVVYLQLLLRENKTEELEQYLNKCSQDIEKFLNIGLSGNSIVDTVLYQKYLLSQSKNINLKILADVPATIPIEPMDLCSVIGNALDNAIEACEKYSENAPDRQIEVRVNCERGYLKIAVKNPFRDPPVKEDGYYISSKENPKNHGIGLRSIRQTALKYHGNTKITLRDHYFILTIIMRLFDI